MSLRTTGGHPPNTTLHSTAKGAALSLNCPYSKLGSTHQSHVIGARRLPSLCLGFLIHEMGIIIVTTSWGGCDD